MPRKKKNGIYINLRMDVAIYDRLVTYCEEEDRTRTSVIERALREYFKNIDEQQISVREND